MRTGIGLLLAGTLFLSGCTEPGETTGVASATGGVLGAGLGAIVGNQTGSTGEGLVVGAVAGSATGAVLGNIIEEQDKAIQTQDEAIERQEQRIQAQRRELNELRAMGQDNVQFRGAADDENREYVSGLAESPSARELIAQRNQEGPQPLTQERSLEVSERTLLTEEDSSRAALRPQFDTLESPAQEMRPEPQMIPEEDAGEAPLVEMIGPAESSITTAEQPLELAEESYVSFQGANTEECRQAEQEAQQGSLATDTADRLFHYRRALRLCPTNPAYHNEIGRIYVSLQRYEDAEFEFREALRLDPQFEAARANLRGLSAGG